MNADAVSLFLRHPFLPKTGVGHEKRDDKSALGVTLVNDAPGGHSTLMRPRNWGRIRLKFLRKIESMLPRATMAAVGCNSIDLPEGCLHHILPRWVQ